MIVMENDTLSRVLQMYTHVNLKLNKDKCYFRCAEVLFFGEWHKAYFMEAQSNDRDVPQKELLAFFGIINYPHKFSPSAADVFEALR